MILIASPLADPEPRLQVALEAPLRTPYIFGQTVEDASPGNTVPLMATYGWPVPLAALPAGDYTVQAVFNRYETFRRGDGSVVKLPPDMGEGQHWNEKPGNFYSRPVRVHLGPGARPLALTLDQVIPPVKPLPETPFVKLARGHFPGDGSGARRRPIPTSSRTIPSVSSRRLQSDPAGRELRQLQSAGRG